MGKRSITPINAVKAMKHPLITAVLLLTSTWVAPPAKAEAPSKVEQDQDPQREQANALFQEGLRLRDAHNDAEAYDKLKQAYALFPSPNVLFFMARTEHGLGFRLAALRHYREALANPRFPKANVAFTQACIAELEPSFGRVLVKGPEGTTVAIDGHAFRLPMSEAFDVGPIAFTVMGRRGDETYEARVTPVVGGVTTVELVRMGEPLVAVEASEGDLTGRQVVGLAAGCLGGVALSVGVGFLALHVSDASDANAITKRDSAVCADASSYMCKEWKSTRDSAKRALWVSGISFGAAAALGVTAGILLWPKKETARATARVIPTGQGLLLEGTF